MAETVVFDYSQGRPTAEQIKAAGGVAAMRYLWFEGSNRKDLTSWEVAELLNGGVGIGFIWETTSSRALAGYFGGHYDARRAAEAIVTLGVNDEPAIWFAVDFDVSNATQFKAVQDYFLGINAVLPKARVKVYGEYDVCQMLMREGLASGFWQTTAWSTGKWSPEHHMIQRVGYTTVGGVTADVNHWNSEGFPVLDGIHFKGGELMSALTPDEQREMFDMLRDQAPGKEGVRHAGATYLEHVELLTLTRLNAEELAEQRVILDQVAVGAIDYDKLADALADRLSARMAD